MIGDGSAIKTTSYIDNLVAATFFLWERLGKGLNTYTYVDAPAMSMRQLVSRIYEELDRNPPSWYLPVALTKSVAKVSDVTAAVTGIDLPITAARIEKFCPSTYFDASAIRDLGFEQPVNNTTAVADTVRWQLGESQ